VTKRRNKLAFIFGQPYQISVIFGSKAGAYPCETLFRWFPLVYALGLTCKYQTRQERLDVKNSLTYFVSLSLEIEKNKLECFSLTILSMPTLHLLVSHYPTRVEYLSGAPFCGKFLATPATYQITNTSAYLASLSVTKKNVL
jgi:hypothetical protein